LRDGGRGAEQTGGSYYFLDMTALGRQEDYVGRSRRGARPIRERGNIPDFAT